MFSNSPSLDHYRTAELRREEDRMTAANRQLHVLLDPAPGRLQGLRNGVGQILVAVGNRMITETRLRAGVQESAIS